MGRRPDEFGFGIESEFLLLDSKTFRPLWWEDVPFSRLNEVLESIPLRAEWDLNGLELESPHRKLMPFVAEGYGMTDADFRVVDVRVKGVEIRTPVCSSLDSCLKVHGDIHAALGGALEGAGWVTAALSHHPVAERFSGPQNKRRHDFWLWAMQAMTTYGPDINLSLPADLAKHVDLKDLESKVNAYAPAMAAFSLASPFFGGKPWQMQGRRGLSVRTWRRSVVAPPIEIHPDEDGRLEFKVFEMSPFAADYRRYFLLFLALLLDEKLGDRAEAAERVYTSGLVALDGLRTDWIRSRGAALLESARRVLPRYGFDPAPLLEFERRFELRRTPADEMLEGWDGGQTLESLLRERARLIPEAEATGL